MFLDVVRANELLIDWSLYHLQGFGERTKKESKDCLRLAGAQRVLEFTA